MTIDYNELKKTIEATLTEMGFSLLATLIRDDFNPKTCEGRSGQSHWAVTVNFNGKSYTTEYHKGAAHRCYYSFSGRKGSPVNLNKWKTIDDQIALERSRPNKPTLPDVMYALVMDSQEFHYGCLDFEEWAENYGYDTDSRSAENTYNACRACYVALKRMGVDFDRLCELFQDY